MTLEIPQGWAALAERLARAPWRRLVVLGGTDVGKSSFCGFLAAMLARRGDAVGLLDSDLGQKMIGPPACVTLGHFTSEGTLDLERIRFVGEVSPTANMAGVIAASARLAAASFDRLIVNTSGLITGPGLALKRWKLDALDPDQVVAIARAAELEAILAPLPPERLWRLRPSPAARRKSARVRVRNRQSTLRAALGDSRPVALPGLIVEDLRHAAVEATRLRLCGLADAGGEDRGIGLLRWSDYAARGELWTGIDTNGLRRLRLGADLAAFGDMLLPGMPSPDAAEVTAPRDRGGR